MRDPIQIPEFHCPECLFVLQVEWCGETLIAKCENKRIHSTYDWTLIYDEPTKTWSVTDFSSY